MDSLPQVGVGVHLGVETGGLRGGICDENHGTLRSPGFLVICKKHAPVVLREVPGILQRPRDWRGGAFSHRSAWVCFKGALLE